jgi:hypothetical protein
MYYFNHNKMKYLITLIMIFYSFNMLAQTKEEFLRRVTDHPGYETEFVSKSFLKIKNKLSGNIVYKDLNIKLLPSDFIADLTIDLRTIDTSHYSHLYTIWSEIPVFGDPLLFADANKDKRKEVYGTYKQFNTESSIVIYEINDNGGYDSVYQYPDSLGWIVAITDLEKDGNLETSNLSFSSSLGWYLNILEKDSVTGYPTSIKLKYNYTYPVNGQPTRINFYDMDGDGYPEMIYYFDGTGDSLIIDNSNHVCKYDRENNTLNLIYQNKPPTSTPVIGYAFGDFDLDGKANFSVGSVWGEVFVYEYVDGNEFNLIRIDSLPISNAFLSTFTTDLDDNGKPELWIGGDGYIDGVGSTLLYLFEATGDDQYEIVYTIAIIGVISFFAGNMLPVDLDNDGQDEVLLCIDQHVLVFKNVSGEYKLLYIKRNELMNQNSVYLSATAADLDDDGYPEILISMDLVENNSIKGFSRIYKKSSTINVNNEYGTNPQEYFLSQAYPNPFNPVTTIKFNTTKEERVILQVYNLLGEEIKELLNETRQSGEYEITWNGTDNLGNKVSSGIYVITMNTKNFNKSIKTVLIK